LVRVSVPEAGGHGQPPLCLVLGRSRLDFARQQPAVCFLTLPVGR
jgi:hypothetical protein